MVLGHPTLSDVAFCCQTGKSCGDPGLIKYADRKGTSFKFRDEVQYRCAPGFRPTSVWDSNSAYNTITITCELNGWNGRAQCEGKF